LENKVLNIIDARCDNESLILFRRTHFSGLKLIVQKVIFKIYEDLFPIWLCVNKERHKHNK